MPSVDTRTHMERAAQLHADGQSARALEEAVEAAKDDDADATEAARMAAALCLELGRTHEAGSWSTAYRERGGDEVVADRIDVMIALAQERLADAGRLLDRLEIVGGRVRSPASWVQTQRARIALAADDPATAFTHLCEAIEDTEVPWQAWVLLAQAAVDLPEVSAAVNRLARAGAEEMGLLVEGPAAGVDRLMEAVWADGNGRAPALAVIAIVGSQLDLERAMVWSQRLRAMGEANDCPVLGIAADDRNPGPLRVRAAASVVAAFGDERAEAVLVPAVRALTASELAASYAEVAAVAPDLVEVFVAAAACDAARTVAMAEVLAEPQTVPFSVGLLEHALQTADGGEATVRWLAKRMSPAARGLVAEAAQRQGRQAVAALVE